MNAFDDVLDVIFDDPNIGEDASWRVGGVGDPIPVRIVRKSPDAVVGYQDARFDLAAMLIDVRLAEVPVPAVGDVVVLADDTSITISGLGKIDGLRLVQTCEAAPTP